MKKSLLAILLLLTAFPIFAQEEEESNLEWFLRWLSIEFDTGPETTSLYKAPNYQDLIKKVDLQKDWKFSIGDNMGWATAAYNDRLWDEIPVPARWENHGFNGYDGIAWYRVHFDGRKLNPKQSHFALLGQIDDADECYVNGRIIGKSGRFAPNFKTAYTAHRNYLIPNELINFDGDNVIAVRVFDQVLDGGIIGGQPGIYASINSEHLLQDLTGPWRFRKNDRRDVEEIEYDDSDWDEIWVPSKWDDQGYRTHDGIAWYRRSFEPSFSPNPNEQYYLLMGKIDDFDVTYLNGIRVGMTNDGKRFGESNSFDQLRVYRIPKGLLKSGSQNVIAVQVTDIGYHGGILKGPIGIVSESQIDGFN